MDDNTIKLFFEKAKVKFSSEEVDIIVNDLRELTKKQPGYFKILLNIFLNSCHDISSIHDILNRIKSCFEKLMGLNHYFNHLKKPIKSIDSLDEMEDSAEYLERLKRTNNIVQKLNKHLRDEIKADPKKFKTIMSKIQLIDVESFVQSYRGMTYSDYKELLDAMDTYGISRIKEKIEETPGATLVYDDGSRLLIAYIQSFNACRILGTKRWAISYAKSYYEHYIKPGYKHFHIWDLSKPSINNSFLIGVTFDEKGDMKYCHNQDGSIADYNNPYDAKKAIEAILHK